MNITLKLAPEQQAGLDSATAKSNEGAPSPLTSQQFLEASIVGILDGFAAARDAERKTQAAEVFAAQPVAIQEALLAEPDWSGIVTS